MNLTVLSAAALACSPAMRGNGSSASAVALAELGIDPGPRPRDLFAGPGLHGAVRPKTEARFTVVKCDTGFARFAFHRRHQELGEHIGVDDVQCIRQKTEGLELQ
jgi:hypothetical protein